MVPVTAKKKGQGPDCLQCKNYYITYDPRQPRGCRAYGFKSQALPSLVVLSISGMVCQLFAVHSTS